MKFLIFKEVQLEKLKNNENVEVDPTRIILAAVENARLVFGSKLKVCFCIVNHLKMPSLISFASRQIISIFDQLDATKICSRPARDRENSSLELKVSAGDIIQT